MRRAVSTVVMSAGWSVRRALFLLVCLTVLFGGSAKSLCAQGTSATINGQITDSQGRSVPGVEVQAVNIDTNVFYPGKTNDSGIYVIPSVPPGRYRLVVLRDGFKEINKTGLVLHVQDTLQQNFALEVGSISESVTVEAGGLVINTTDASVSTVVDRQFAENLPMNGRSFQTLIQLTPGVVIAPSNAQDNGQFNINGQRASSNYWMVDGVSANIGVTSLIATSGNGLAGALGSFSALGGTNSLVSVDAMREFRIQTSTYAPEFGRTPGGQISIVTRSGTNQFHGTVFDYLRNDVLDANDWFADSKGLPKPNERQNDFGGTFSGPILKDKTFFFFSYEGLRLRLPQTALTSVPCDSTCTVFGNARTMAVSAMQPYLNTFPLPNGPEVFTPCTPNVNGCPASGQQPTGLAQFNASYSNPATLDAYSLRVDHRLSSKLSVFGRYNYSPSENRLRGFSSFSLSMVVPTRVTTQTATLGATWAISSRIVNDLRFNYSRTNSSSSNVLDNFAGAVPLTSLPFPNPYTSETSALLAFTIFGVPRGGAFQAGQGVQNLQRQINIVDGVSAQKGSHSLKFGVDFRRLSPLHNPHLYTQEVFFGSVGSAEKGNPLFNVLFSSLKTTFLFRDMDMYAQDTWRVMRRLSLTYGVRWDVGFVPSINVGLGASRDATLQDHIQQLCA